MTHPAAQKVVDRVLGVEWRYQMFDFGAQIGIAGLARDGRRAGVRLKLLGIMDKKGVPVRSVFQFTLQCPELLAAAKEQILDALASGTNVVQVDDCLEGNEMHFKPRVK